MDEYLGYKEVVLTDEMSTKLFDEKEENPFELLNNEYLLARDTSENVIGVFKFSNDRMVRVPFKTITSKFLGKIKPLNRQQEMAVDMLYDPQTTIKVLTGKFGTGKDFLMCSAAIDLLERNKFEKIVYVRNNIEVKDTKPIGYLPGSYDEKLLPFAMPLADHLGGIDGLSILMGKGEVEVVHLGFMRGRDIKNAIILCSEAENMTKEHIQLLIGRVGIGSTLWLNGDFKQKDEKIFEQNSGLMVAVDRLKGHPRFGYVKLLKTERSETAAMADLLD